MIKKNVLYLIFKSGSERKLTVRKLDFVRPPCAKGIAELESSRGGGSTLGAKVHPSLEQASADLEDLQHRLE